MQAYGGQSSSAYAMPSSGFYNGTSSQTPYGVLAPSTYTTMGAVAASHGTRQQCKNGQSLGQFYSIVSIIRLTGLKTFFVLTQNSRTNTAVSEFLRLGIWRCRNEQFADGSQLLHLGLRIGGLQQRRSGPILFQ